MDSNAEYVLQGWMWMWTVGLSVQCAIKYEDPMSFSLTRDRKYVSRLNPDTVSTHGLVLR